MPRSFQRSSSPHSLFAIQASFSLSWLWRYLPWRRVELDGNHWTRMSRALSSNTEKRRIIDQYTFV